MIGGYSTQVVVAAAVGVAALLALVAAGYLWWWRKRTTVDEELDEELPGDDEILDQLEEERGDEDEDLQIAEFESPKISLSPLDWIRAGRHLQKQRKAAKRGWVKWYRVGANISAPQWVKPVREGSGTPKVTDGGQPYYFEKDAMVVDERTGAWVAVHPEGEADPINLADRAYPGIETDLVERIINLEAEDNPSTSLLGLDGMSQQQLMWIGIGLMFVLFAAYRYMG